jgi:DNA-binding transcriptional LysR family regulator
VAATAGVGKSSFGLSDPDDSPNARLGGMQIQSFKIFCDLVETGSFSQAAELNRVTQSAVSQQVRALEERLGAKLLIRGPKNFSLSPEGRLFLGASQEILNIYDELGNRIQEIRNIISGELRISAIHSIGLHELPTHLRKFRRVYPGVELSIEYRRASQVYSDVLDGNADVGFVAFPARRAGLVIESIWQDRLVLICPPDHQLAVRRNVRFRDLRDERFVSFEPDQPTARAIDARLKKASVSLGHALEFDNIETVKRAVQIECAVSIVPLTTVQDEIGTGRLAAVEIAEEDMWRPLGLLTKRGRSASPALKKFIELLKASELVPESARDKRPESRHEHDGTPRRTGASRRGNATRSSARRQNHAGTE